MAQYDINLREYWRILKKRKAIVIATAIIMGFFSTAFAIFRAPTPIYVSTCSIKFEKETTVEGLYARTISWSGADDIETQISVIKSYSVFERVAEKLGLIPKIGDAKDRKLDPGRIGVIESLQAKVNVFRENFTNILGIRVQDTDRDFVQKLANTIALTYKELHSEQQLKRTTDAINYIDEQLKSVRKKLREAEDEFNQFTQANQLISIDLQGENILAREQTVQNQIRTLREHRTELEGILGRLKQFVKKPSGSGHNFFSAKAATKYQDENNTLVGLLLRRETLLETFTPQHPDVIAIDYKVAETARKMVLLLELEIGEVKKREDSFAEELATIERKSRGLMEKKLEFNRLKRKVELYNDMTALLERKNQEALIRKAEKPEEITIVKPALPPGGPINPPKTKASGAMGVIIGLVLGLVTAFIVETFDTSLGTIEDVEETLGSEVLGVIPFADAKDIQDMLEDSGPEGIEESPRLESAHLVTHFIPKSMIAESFRGLRTNIQFKDAEKKVKTFSVASASPQEGKTFISINLAITMAQSGMKVLLVGADMRKPMMGKAFGLEITPGLSDILMGNHSWNDVVKTITDLIMGKMTMDEVMVTPGLDNLHIITSGAIPPNPSVLIESKRLKDFIEEAEKVYDFIIFDSPPILSTADAAILGSKMDGVLLIYRVGSISKGLLKRSSTQLEQVNCNILGVILNGMKPEFSPDFQDFKYYKYYYTYEEEPEDSGRFARGLSFLKSLGGRKWKEEGAGPAPDEAKSPPMPESRFSRLLRWFLLIIALAFLAVGILRQGGLFSPMKIVDAAAESSERGKAISPKDDRFASKSAGATVDKKTVQMPIGKRPAASAREETPQKPVPAPQPPAADDPSKAAQEVHTDENRPHQPFSLYLGSFRTLERAETAISRFRKKGLSPYWVKVRFKEKGVWFRVYSNAFPDQAQAERFMGNHQLEGVLIKKTAYAALIGIYDEEKAVQEASLKLSSLGYHPYEIKSSEGTSYLYVGAFLTKSAAEREHAALKQDGIENQVVQR